MGSAKLCLLSGGEFLARGHEYAGTATPKMIQRFANRVMWLDRGKLVAMGEPKEVIEQYLAASKVTKLVATQDD